jgi:uncharacterized protein YjbI with pentapeptide repeats
VAESVLSFAFTACSRMFDAYEKIHGGQRFRLYMWEESSPSINPPLIYDYKNKFQREVEKAADLKRFDFSQKDLREFDFSGKDLTGVKISGSNLRRINLRGANLAGIELTDCNLTGAEFTKSILNEAKIKNCQLDRANFDGAVLKQAEIRGSDLFQSSFIKSDLTGAKIVNKKLSKTFFYKAKLVDTVFEISATLYDCVFRLCNLRSASFQGKALKLDSIMNGCDFRNSDLTDCKFTVNLISQTRLIQCKLVNSDFSGSAIISGCNFRGSSCLAMNLEGVQVENCNFVFVNLSKLRVKKGSLFAENDFSYAQLAGYDFTTSGYLFPNRLLYTDLSNCNLQGTDLSASETIFTNFQGANLKGAIFKEDQLKYINLSSIQKRELDLAIGDTERN